ncbi:zinc-ribbon and DUF3426 domain-containing protein [Variovorax sp. RHLX14]|uniref:zinc-ribbon and DUF3426 domain-containing protein n=1 Tax=Variovorax sp. RHLX14 TaxID=1259731 RepID=UPI003F482DDD
MSLATRCPACGTTFKVVPDQLRISDGWVRCGRCSEIFDGNENMQEPGAVEADLPDPTETAVAAPVASAIPASGMPDRSAFDFPDFSAFPGAPPVETAVDEGTRATEPADDRLPEDDPVSTDAAVQQVPAPWLGQWPSLELKPGAGTMASEASLPSAATAIAATPATAATAATPVAAPDATFDVARASALAEPAAPTSSTSEQDSASKGETSGFATLDRPEGTLKRWLRRIPGLDRLPLRTISAGAVVLLGAQMVYQSRDAIAARQPAFQPALTAMCKVAGCAVSAFRHIDSITIDGASFARDPSGEGYQLSFTLRNRAAVPLAMPAVELTLLDTQEQAVVRRVLLPADFNAPDVLPASTERSTTLPLALSAAPALAPVAGYGIAAFYP